MEHSRLSFCHFFLHRFVMRNAILHLCVFSTLHFDWSNVCARENFQWVHSTLQLSMICDYKLMTVLAIDNVSLDFAIGKPKPIHSFPNVISRYHSMHSRVNEWLGECAVALAKYIANFEYVVLSLCVNAQCALHTYNIIVPFSYETTIHHCNLCLYQFKYDSMSR